MITFRMPYITFQTNLLLQSVNPNRATLQSMPDQQGFTGIECALQPDGLMRNVRLDVAHSQQLNVYSVTNMVQCMTFCCQNARERVLVLSHTSALPPCRMFCCTIDFGQQFTKVHVGGMFDAGELSHYNGASYVNVLGNVDTNSVVLDGVLAARNCCEDFDLN